MTNKPHALEICLGTGPYAWCRCQHSKNNPWCDGNHKKENKVAPLVFHQPIEETVFICRCGQTQTPPFCDDTQDCLSS